jgi:hypothetical protein
MERVSSSRAASDVAAAFKWILAATAFKWIPAATTSSRPSRPEFQHSSPTFWLRILAAVTMGNASVDDTDAAATTTFFFTTDDKSLVPTFNCSIHNTSKCQMSRLLIHFCFQASFIIG